MDGDVFLRVSMCCEHVMLSWTVCRDALARMCVPAWAMRVSPPLPTSNVAAVPANVSAHIATTLVLCEVTCAVQSRGLMAIQDRERMGNEVSRWLRMRRYAGEMKRARLTSQCCRFHSRYARAAILASFDSS